ncbi:MAG TPA: glycosyltransferase family 4 protein, partial [Polyangiaceae bacterium]|nr:glycosyltransferase family 4 protein [Polyangiaceae bacterium]
MSEPASLRAVLVDPSLFTAPYDAALTEGLLASGVEPRWAVRPIRQGDRQLIEGCEVDAFFYRRVDELRGVPRALRAVVKGVAHAVGLLRLVGRVLRHRPHVVHFQWAVVPPLDALAMGALKRCCPVVLTVHDTVPFNGERPPWLFRLGLELPLRLADRVIVHTQSGRDRLLERGVPREKIAVIPHGPLELRALPSGPKPGEQRDARWTFVLFGELKHYKGLDVLIEALGQLPASLRAEARVIIAGRPLMDLAPLERRIAELHLDAMVEIRPRRQTEEEMANLFAEANCFLFPYRQVDA